MCAFLEFTITHENKKGTLNCEIADDKIINRTVWALSDGIVYASWPNFLFPYLLDGTVRTCLIEVLAGWSHFLLADLLDSILWALPDGSLLLVGHIPC